MNPVDWHVGFRHYNNVTRSSAFSNWQFAAVRLIGFLAIHLLATILAGTDASAQHQSQPIILSSNTDYYESVVGHARYLLDPGRRLVVSDVEKNRQEFKPIETPYLDLGLTTARVWLHFSAKNETPSAGRWRLDVKRQYIKELEVFVVRSGQPLQLLAHKETESFYERSIPSRFLQSDFDLGPSETADFYIGYISSSTTFLPIFLAKPDGSNNVHNREANIDWAMNGALFAMILLALLLIPVIGWKIGVSFCLYILAGTFYVANADGYTFQYLWPDQSWLNDRMNLAAILLMPATALSFSRQLFQFSDKAPQFDRFLNLFVMFVLFVAIMVPFLYDFRWFMVPAYFLVPIGALFQLSSGLVAYRIGRVGALPYILGAVLVVSSFAYATIAHLIPGYFDLDFTLDYGHFVLFMDCIAFATAIMLRVLALREERNQAMETALAASQEQLRLSQALVKSQRAYGEAQRLSEHRLDQLSNVSHDIRQPLVSLRAAMDRIRGHDEQATEQMNAAFDYLERIAIDEVSRDQNLANTGSRDRNLEKFSIQIVLDNVNEISAEEAREHGKSLRYYPLDRDVRSDPVALMRVVSNLVSNAIKHGGNSILLGARLRGDHVRIEIWDDGRGMASDELDRAMQRGHKSVKSSGSGLGLSIIVEIAERLGLDFKLHSRKGSGSAGFVHVPVSK